MIDNTFDPLALLQIVIDCIFDPLLIFSLPMFMRDVLKYDLDTSGILAAFPYILMAIVVQVKKLLVQPEAVVKTGKLILFM